MPHALRENTDTSLFSPVIPSLLPFMTKALAYIMSKQSVADETKTSQLGNAKPARIRVGFGFPNPGGLL